MEILELFSGRRHYHSIFHKISSLNTNVDVAEHVKYFLATVIYLCCTNSVFRCKSLPMSHLLEDLANIPDEWSQRSMSPGQYSHGSSDLVLNPERLESEV